MKENIIIPAGTTSIDVETLVKINAGSIPVPNKPPVVSIIIPSNIELPAVLTLKATATDSDGFIASYLWTKTSGPAAVITSPDKALTDVTGLVPGFYAFNLKVTDDKGAVTNTIGNVTVKPAVIIPPPTNLSPIVKAGADVVLTTNYTILKGTATPAAGKTIASYLWSHVSGPTLYSIHNANAVHCGFGDLGEGVHVFRLTATDNTGLIGTDDVSVTVNISTVPPVIPPVVIPPVVIPPTGAIKYLQLPRGQVKTYSGITGLTIERQSFFNQDAGLQNGNILWFNNCHDITIIDCYFGSSKGVAIYCYQCSNIRVFTSLAAYVRGFINASTCSGGIYGKGLQMFNGSGSGLKDGRDGNIYKLVECNGPGFILELSAEENFAGECNPEDLVSIYKSSGTAASPISIRKNMFRGGSGTSISGGGVVLGDGAGRYGEILDNVLFNPGQYGVAVAGGHDQRIEGNYIWSDKSPVSNNPVFIYEQSGVACSKITIRNNYGKWIDKAGNPNNGWNDGKCSGVTFEYLKPITLAEMKSKIPDHLITYLTPAELLQVRAAK